MKHRLVLSGLLLSSVTLFGQKAPSNEALKPADQMKSGGIVAVGTGPSWEVSDEQRIAGRSGSSKDPVGGRIKAAAAPGGGYSESIEGRDHPELLFPYELFDKLLSALSSDPHRAANAHSLYDHKLAAAGYNQDAFWATLRSVAQPYVTLREKRAKAGPHATVTTLPDGQRIFVPVAQDVCSARIATLDEARRALGGKTFDRFLYTAVAPEIGISSGGSEANRAEQLRFIARGCK